MSENFDIEIFRNVPIVVEYPSENFGEFVFPKNKTVRVVKHGLYSVHQITVAGKEFKDRKLKVTVTVRDKTFKVQSEPLDYDRIFMFQAAGNKLFHNIQPING
jgi:hypothetical protein